MFFFLLNTFTVLGVEPSGAIVIPIAEVAAAKDIGKATAAWVAGIDPEKPNAMGFVLTNRETKPTFVSARLNLSAIEGKWTDCTAVKLVIYSAEASNAHLNIQFSGRDPYSKSYWLMQISADWTGWKTFVIPVQKLTCVNRDTSFPKDHFVPLSDIQFLNTGWKVQTPEEGKWAMGEITFLPDILSVE